MAKATARPRKDPKSTAADGFRDHGRLLRRDPHRHYVFVNPNDELAGVSAYEAAGYSVESVTDDGVRPVVGNGKDGVWHVLGQVLMSCPIEDFEERVADGQKISDAFDARMLKQGNIEKDGFRGRGVSLGVNTSLGRPDERMSEQFAEGGV